MLFDPVLVSRSRQYGAPRGQASSRNAVSRWAQIWRSRPAGPDLAAVASLIPAELPELPAEPYEIAGRVRVLADGYALDAARGQRR